MFFCCPVNWRPSVWRHSKPWLAALSLLRPNAGGVPELVTHEVDGFAEAVGDVESQARRVVSLLTNDALFDRMCSAARDSAVGRFATSRIIPQYESYYEDVLR